jgi:hypothetical protein
MEVFMSVPRRVYISMPADQWLTDDQNQLKWAIVDYIESFGFTTEIFFDPRGGSGLAAGRAWSAVEANRIARRCVGAAVLGFPRRVFTTDEGTIAQPSEFCHYEGAMAYTLGLPMLVFVQENVQRRTVFEDTHSGYVGTIPSDADVTWLESKEFRVAVDYWKKAMSHRRDVFLGYASTSSGTAKNLKRFLESDLKATVLDWQSDFAPTMTILDQIEAASARCATGIFLFTRDDKLADGGPDRAVPRDNVVFEAGYFIGVKGSDHVLIVREEGAKMPADLGGKIYALLNDRADIQPIEETVRRFLNAL